MKKTAQGTGAADLFMSWSWGDMQEAQRHDDETGPVVKWLQESPEKPPWNAVALKSSATKNAVEYVGSIVTERWNP